MILLLPQIRNSPFHFPLFTEWANLKLITQQLPAADTDIVSWCFITFLHQNLHVNAGLKKKKKKANEPEMNADCTFPIEDKARC